LQINWIYITKLEGKEEEREADEVVAIATKK
jgi:hypothetical protein